MLQAGKFPKNRGSIFGVIMGHNFASRLVIGNDSRWWWVDADSKRLAIDFDLITILNSLANEFSMVIKSKSMASRFESASTHHHLESLPITSLLAKL